MMKYEFLAYNLRVFEAGAENLSCCQRAAESINFNYSMAELFLFIPAYPSSVGLRLRNEHRDIEGADQETEVELI